MTGRAGVPGRLKRGSLRGVWQWSVDESADLPVDRLEAVGDSLRWHTVVLDTSGVSDKEQFLDVCSATFSLPSWFGMNWDALIDCLSDLDVGESQGILIAWRGWRDFAEADPDEFGTAVQVLTDVCARWADDDVAGTIVLLGARGGQPDGGLTQV